MKRIGAVGVLVLCGLLFSRGVRAQDKPETREFRPGAALKLSVVLSEFDGTKKVTSLPYTFHVNADDNVPNGQRTSQVRVGLRVPVRTGGSATGVGQFQYMDIGTNLDCRVSSLPEGRFMLVLSVERTYLYELSQAQSKQEAAAADNLGMSGVPVIGRFNSNYDLPIRDGQTIEATSTTDPVSGRVLKIEVTANVVK